jgi:nucleolar protein 9
LCPTPTQVTLLQKGDDPTKVPEPSDYLNAVLRDPISSHLLETLVTRSPDNAFAVLWTTYFQNKLMRLARHPVANFVVAKALERVDREQLAEACRELEGTWKDIISKSSLFCVLMKEPRANIAQNQRERAYYVP